MPRDPNHRSMGIWMLLLCLVLTRKTKQAWFVVNNVLIRYSLREHALLSGLHCHEFPNNYKGIRDFKFIEKHFKKAKVTQEAIEKKFLCMRTYSRDMLKMVVLYFLSSILKGNAKRGVQATSVDPFIKRIVVNLEDYVTFSWGRLSFYDNLEKIKRMMGLFNSAANPHANFSGFVIPLELLAFKEIPKHMECPRMCKSKFRRCGWKGFQIKEIDKALDEAEVKLVSCYLTNDSKHLESNPR